ncbi:MAG TPA: hypothetical protein VMF60_10715, partial [Acidimicrobiales bacterium]|nr:hypothetical protein [Acidimicrobiales bacterium]
WASLVRLMGARGAAGRDEPGRAEGAALQLEARRHHDAWDRLGDVVSPTFVCGGRYDAIAPPENSERLASAIPDARLALFEGGHLFLLQDRGAWPAIAAFLSAR